MYEVENTIYQQIFALYSSLPHSRTFEDALAVELRFGRSWKNTDDFVECVPVFKILYPSSWYL